LMRSSRPRRRKNAEIRNSKQIQMIQYPNPKWKCASLAALLAVLSLPGSGAWARKPDGALGLIRYPISTNPTLALPGGGITLRLSSEKPVCDVRVELLTKGATINIFDSAPGESFKPEDRRTFGCPFERLPFKHREMNWGWRSRVTVRDLARIPIKLPDDLPEGFYGLRVTCSAGSDTSERAVRIFREWPAKYEICHITDVHIGKNDVPAAGRVFLKIAQRVSRQKPAFVLLTGDNVDSAMPDQFHLFLAVVDRFEAPTFVIPGNHDAFGRIRDGKADALTFFGDTYYSFDFGEDHYLGMDGATPKLDKEQMKFIEDDLAGVPPGRFKCVFNHAVAFQDARKYPWLLSAFEKYDVNLYLCGHKDTGLIEVLTGTLSVRTEPAFRCGSYNTIAIENHQVKFARPGLG